MSSLPVMTWARIAADGANPSEVTVDRLKRMLRMSALVRFAYEDLRRSIIGRIGTYQNPERPDIAEDVTATLLPVIRRDGANLLSALYYGMVLAEPVWQTAGGRLSLLRLHCADPEDWWDGQPERDPATGQITGWARVGGVERVAFFGRGGTRQVIHWQFGGDFDSAWGDGCGQRAYGHDLYLRQLYQWEGIGSEVAALPRLLPLCQSGDEATLEAVAQSLQALGAKTAVALNKSQVDSVQVIAGAFDSGSPFNDPIQHHKAGIATAFMRRPLAQMESQFQTRAATATQRDADLDLETSLTEQFRDEVLLPQLIAVYLRLQYGPDAPIGTLTIEPAVPPDPIAWAGAFADLCDRAPGLLVPNHDPHRAQVSERLGFDLGTIAEVGLPGVDEELADAEALRESLAGRAAEADADTGDDLDDEEVADAA